MYQISLRNTKSKTCYITSLAKCFLARWMLLTSRGFVVTLRGSCTLSAPGTSTIPGALLRQGADREAMKTKTNTKRGIRAREPVACPHDRLYACIAERDDGAYGTFIVCSRCAFAIAVNDVVFAPPSLRPAAWMSVRPCEETDAGARITILAGPGADYAPLALACLDRLEAKRVANEERLHADVEAISPANGDAKIVEVRERVRAAGMRAVRERMDRARAGVVSVDYDKTRVMA